MLINLQSNHDIVINWVTGDDDLCFNAGVQLVFQFFKRFFCKARPYDVKIIFQMLIGPSCWNSVKTFLTPKTYIKTLQLQSISKFSKIYKSYEIVFWNF